MDTRATRTRLSVIPVFIALLFNIVAPVLAMAVPEAVPDAVAPKVAVAADAPDQVTFTLEGCRLENGDFIEATLTCTEPGYTTGNLGKEWAELDRVPHRLTATNGNGAQTYDVNISADHLHDATIGLRHHQRPDAEERPMHLCRERPGRRRRPGRWRGHDHLAHPYDHPAGRIRPASSTTTCASRSGRLATRGRPSTHTCSRRASARSAFRSPWTRTSRPRSCGRT